MLQSRMNTTEKFVGLIQEAGFTSIRIWSERFAHQWTLDGLLALQLGCGMAARRLSGLTALKRRRLLQRVEARLSRLTQDELVYEPEVLYAVAHRPDC